MYFALHCYLYFITKFDLKYRFVINIICSESYYPNICYLSFATLFATLISVFCHSLITPVSITLVAFGNTTLNLITAPTVMRFFYTSKNCLPISLIGSSCLVFLIAPKLMLCSKNLHNFSVAIAPS